MESLSNRNGRESRVKKDGFSYFSQEEDMKHYRGMVFQFVLKNLEGNTNKFSIAEEITQDTMLLAWRNLNNFNGDSDFKTWLFKIAINSTNNYFRYRKAKSFPDRDMSGHTGVFSLESDLGDHEDADGYERPGIVSSLTYNPSTSDGSREEFQNKLITDFSRTIKNSKHRTMFLLAAHGSSPIEVSLELNINVQSVKTVLFRLRKRLMEYARRNKLILDENLLSQVVEEIRGNNGRRKGNNNEKE